MWPRKPDCCDVLDYIVFIRLIFLNDLKLFKVELLNENPFHTSDVI